MDVLRVLAAFGIIVGLALVIRRWIGSSSKGGGCCGGEGMED